MGVLLKVLPDINRKFGLSAEQVERLAPDRRLVVFKAITAGGSLLVGRIVTRELVMGDAAHGGRAAERAAGGEVRAHRRAGPVGGTDLRRAALRVRAAHPQCMAICEQLRLPAPTEVVGG